MSTFDLSQPQRIRVTLDPALVLERLILGRLSGVRAKRGQDWLRSLLVQGFLTEGRWLRRERHAGNDRGEPREPGIPATPFGTWLEQADSSTRRAAPTPTVTSSGPNPVATASFTKPFAHLRRVIG